jgi:NAD(P)-dependent dehydrogenase (short-subunit alcohol dehydrogenase family)
MGAVEGKVALVTGGASGIGLATIQLFAEEGARTVVVDVQPPPEGVGDLFIEADVGDAAAWPGIVSRVEEDLGGLDVAYLNAGVTTREADITALTDAQYQRIMRVNVDGVVFGIRAVVPAIARRGGGAVIATASLAGLIAFAADPIYTLTKHAVVGLCRSLAPQLKDKGITINAVCPGITETPLVGLDAVRRLQETGFPIIPPRQIAEAVLMCATGDVTGQAFACQPGREPTAYRFSGVPGPRVAGAEGMRPPDEMAGVVIPPPR